MNRIIVNWMYPRSLTTVFMRAITNRGDFHTIFEPTLPIYWRDRHEPGVQSHQDYEGWPVVYEDVIKKIYSIAEKSPTFIKECPYHAIDKYLADEEYLRRCTHMFQIRNPKYVVLSFWKVIGSQRSMRIEDVGPVASDRIFNRITELGLHALDNGKTPLVIDGDDFQNDPAGIMAAEAEAQAIMQVQTALADSLKLLNAAAPNDQVVKLKALEAMQKVADGKATKIIIPSELQGLAGLAASAKTVFDTEDPKGE